MERSNEADKTKSLSSKVGEKMTTIYIKKMIELIDRKKKMLERLLQLSKEQGNFIKDENMDAINNVLVEKQKTIDEIDIIDKEFLYVYEKVKEGEDIDSLDMIDIEKYGNLKTLKQKVNDINSILDEISKLDHDNLVNMESSIKKIKSDLKQVKEAKRAYKGYNYESVESILIDEKK